jgi:hypothetical protein
MGAEAPLWRSSASVEDSVAYAEADAVRDNRTKRELKPLLILHVDQADLQIAAQHKVHSYTRRNRKYRPLPRP